MRCCNSGHLSFKVAISTHWLYEALRTFSLQIIHIHTLIDHRTRPYPRPIRAATVAAVAPT